MKSVIIKYGGGNVRSVDFALKRIGVDATISDDIEVIKQADKVIFPGVGEAASTMAYLKERKLDLLIKDLKQPVLGICLGMQLMCSHSEEGDVECLGIFDEKVKRFRADKGMEFEQKIPHMGWNTITDLKGELYSGISEEEYLYFVHSYYASVGEHTVATCNYISPFSASLQRDNFYATQFHPEKSGIVGARIVENFIKLR